MTGAHWLTEPAPRGTTFTPEQLTDGRITPATDVYACGVVADEILPNARPASLQEVVARCLREDPDERFADAG